MNPRESSENIKPYDNDVLAYVRAAHANADEAERELLLRTREDMAQAVHDRLRLNAWSDMHTWAGSGEGVRDAMRNALAAAGLWDSDPDGQKDRSPDA